MDEQLDCHQAGDRSTDYAPPATTVVERRQAAHEQVCGFFQEDRCNDADDNDRDKTQQDAGKALRTVLATQQYKRNRMMHQKKRKRMLTDPGQSGIICCK